MTVPQGCTALAALSDQLCHSQADYRPTCACHLLAPSKASLAQDWQALPVLGKQASDANLALERFTNLGTCTSLYINMPSWLLVNNFSQDSSHYCKVGPGSECEGEKWHKL